jgi:hypothetical protein
MLGRVTRSYYRDDHNHAAVGRNADAESMLGISIKARGSDNYGLGYQLPTWASSSSARIG